MKCSLDDDDLVFDPAHALGGVKLFSRRPGDYDFLIEIHQPVSLSFMMAFVDSEHLVL